MRAGLVLIVAIAGCVATVGAAPRSADDTIAPGADALKALNETPITGPAVPLDQLIDQIPDGGIVIELYKGVRTIRDVEAVNEYVKAQVVKAQSIVANIARLHAATFKSCDGSQAPQIEAIARKARNFATTLVRVDGELTKSLAATRQEVETGRPSSTRAKEDLNRFVLSAHELGRLRVQAQEIAKSVEGLGVSIRSAEASCRQTSILPLFAEREAPAVIAPASRSPALSQKRVTKPTTTLTPRFGW